jgi:hypothetical protein
MKNQNGKNQVSSVEPQKENSQAPMAAPKITLEDRIEAMTLRIVELERIVGEIQKERYPYGGP